MSTPSIPVQDEHDETVLVKAASHRARLKLLQLTGARAVAVASVTRELGTGGGFRIPADLQEQALAITGVARLRDGDDLLDAIRFGGGR